MIHFFGKKNKTIFSVESTSPFFGEDINKLNWLLNATYIENKSIKGKFIGPRPTMVTPWSTNAVEILQNMGDVVVHEDGTVETLPFGYIRK